MRSLFRGAALSVAFLAVSGVALASSTAPPSVGGAIAELGCSPEPSTSSALDGAACVKLAQTLFTYERNAAIVNQSMAEMSLAQESLAIQLDGLELDELESLRLQLSMGRLSVLMTTLSNILKTISDTQDAMTQNMK